MIGELWHILLIEDNDGDARLVKEVLRRTGDVQFTLTRVVEIEELASAIEGREFDVLLLDLTLPDSDGIETVIRARAQAPHLPIVVLTGLEDQRLGIAALRHGAQDYLIKGDVDGWALVKTLRFAMERHRAQNLINHAH